MAAHSPIPQIAVENFDQALVTLSSQRFDQGVRILLPRDKIKQFCHLALIEQVFPYVSVGYLPYPFKDVSENMSYIMRVITTSSLQERLESLEDLEQNSRLYILSIKTLLPIDLAIQRDPCYGYYADFFRIKTYASGRPVTTMSTLIPELPMLEKSSITDVSDGIVTTSKGRTFIPVVRYALGMSGGAYYNKEIERNFCGTFYYMELESSSVLFLGAYRMYRNKFAAFTALRAEIGDENIIRELFVTPDARREYYFALRFDQYAPPEENDYPSSSLIYSYLPGLMEGISQNAFEDNEVNPEDVDQDRVRELVRKFYIEGEVLSYTDPYDNVGVLDPDTNTLKIEDEKDHYIKELYADEDRFDQPLCTLARHVGIDCLILTHMVGKTRLVTEILDTRDRTESYAAIYRLE